MARSKIAQYADKTDASFFSEPPFVFAAAKQGGVTIRCDNWSNTDNQLAVTVQWGEKTLGLLGNSSNITWVSDALTTTILATGGTTAEVVGFIKVPQMASKYMRLSFALSGSSPEVDVVAWFNWSK